MTRRVIAALMLLLAGTVATAQVPFPQTLPANTVYGRLGISAGPGQAIPFSVLTSNLTGSGSGIFGLKLSGDTNYTMVQTDRTVLINANLTTARTVTLFAAATLTTGQQICIADAFGGVTSTNTLTIARSSTDTINGATSYVLRNAFGGACLISDGASKWTVGFPNRSGNTTTFATTSGTLTSGNCIKADASGNLIDNGSPCRVASINSQTANYTVAAADCGKLVQVGTGTTGFFTVTVPSVSGFPTPCAVLIKNGDTGRAKALAGLPAEFIDGTCGASNRCLWPGQTVEISIIGGAWAITQDPGRWKVVSTPTFQVNHASGSDNNDCLATGTSACATIAKAVSLIYGSIDARAKFQPVIQLANETFTENNVFVQGRLVGALVSSDMQDILILGNTGSPSSVVWQTSAGAALIADNGSLRVNGVKFVATASGLNGLQAEKAGLITFLNTEFGAFASGFHVALFEYGQIYFDGGTYVISGNMASHVLCATTGHFLSATATTVTLTGTPVFTDFFDMSGSGCSGQVNMTYSGAGTGRKFNIRNNASLGIGGSTIPGGTAGVTSNGGVSF